MDSRKLERIILCILLLLNVFLLTNVLSDSVRSRRSDAATAAELTALLAKNGLSAADGVIRIQAAPPSCTLTRDMALEQKTVQRLIGSSELTDQGGNILFYDGQKGQALLRGSGETDILLEPGAAPLRGGMERTAQRTLQRAGIGAVASGRETDAESTTEFYGSVDGIPVYNAVLRCDFVGGNLTMITGTRLFDAVTKVDESGLLDSATVLVRFVEIVRNEGFICSRIEAVEPGYLQTVMRSGEETLTPVWQIRTDAGAFFINAKTGKADSRLS